MPKSTHTTGSVSSKDKKSSHHRGKEEESPDRRASSTKEKTTKAGPDASKQGNTAKALQSKGPRCHDEDRLDDDQTLSIHPRIGMTTEDRYMKRLFALSSHLASYAHKNTSKTQPFTIPFYQDLDRLVWAKNRDTTKRTETKHSIKAASDSVDDLPLPIYKGTKPAHRTLRARWRLGMDVGGSNVFLRILFWIRFRAGQAHNGKNIAPLLALCKIRAILLYLSPQYRGITEEDIEGIFQEIRAEKDPKIVIMYNVPTEDKTRENKKTSNTDKGQVNHADDVKTKVKGKSGHEVKTKVKGSSSADKTHKHDERPASSHKEKSKDNHKVAKEPGHVGKMKTAEEDSDSDSITEDIEPPTVRVRRSISVWKAHLPVMHAMHELEKSGAPYKSTSKPLPIPRGYKNYGADMKPAHVHSEGILSLLTNDFPPPRWCREKYAFWQEHTTQKLGKMDLKTDFKAFESVMNELERGDEADLETERARKILAGY